MKLVVALILSLFVLVFSEEQVANENLESTSNIGKHCSTDSVGENSNQIEEKNTKESVEGNPKEKEILEEIKRNENVAVTFRNDYHKTLSLHWLDHNSHPILIELGIPSGQSIKFKSWIGHKFLFSTPGSYNMIGNIYIINWDQTEYILPFEAYDRSSEGGCYDVIPEYCASQKSSCLITPGWMVSNCPKTCDMCDIIDVNVRCNRTRLGISEEPKLKPGDLNLMFESLAEKGKEYNPTILSQPPEGPWVYIFDKFVEDDEIEALLKWGEHYQFARSTDTGPAFSRGGHEKIVSDRRTSTNCWCQAECKEDPIVDKLYKRVENLIDHSRTHFEDYQLLKYLEGQFYRVHHDMSPSVHHKIHGCGPRTLTVFLYLSDVEEGGGTRFPRLNITVDPRKGRMLIWPSVLDEDIFAQDARTHHEALPVIKGVKYASNLWVHSHDFQTSNLWECKQ